MPNNIFELLLKLPTVTDVAITCFSKNNMLYPLKETIHNLQLTYYWWQEAKREMDSYTEEVLTTEADSKGSLTRQPPTLIGAYEQLNYITEHLSNLGKDTQGFLEDTPLPQGVKYKVEQGYNKVMEAMFNADISTKYYDEFNKQSGRLKE